MRPIASKESIQVAERHGPVNASEASVFRHVLRRTEETRPRTTRQRRIDTDSPNTHLSYVRDSLTEFRTHEKIDRFRSDGRNNRPDLIPFGHARRVEKEWAGENIHERGVQQSVSGEC